MISCCTADSPIQGNQVTSRIGKRLEGFPGDHDVKARISPAGFQVTVGHEP